MCVYGEVKLGTVFAFSCPDNMCGFIGSFPRATASPQGPDGDELLLFTLPFASFLSVFVTTCGEIDGEIVM